MRKYSWKQMQRRRCEKLGHDWALQDEGLYMAKVCLRCGAVQIFFPEEVDEDADLGNDNSEKD